MLSLKRNEGERVIITVPPSDKPTTITNEFVRFNGGGVTLGYEAPREVVIHRAEISDRIKQEAASTEGKSHE